MRPTLAFASLFVVLAGTSLADGRMFWPEKVPPSIPYQRALILFHAGIETLIVQSKYEVPKDTAEAESIGWVVPIPTPPKVTSLSTQDSWQLFWDLDFASRPRVTSVSRVTVAILILMATVLAVVALLLSLATFLTSALPWVRRRRGKVSRYAAYTLVVCAWTALVASPALGLGGSSPVDVLSEQQVGIYDVQVIRSDDATALIDWLNDHHFQFSPEDTAVFAAYIARNWCFVVARINPHASQKPEEIAYEGLAAPLVLQFASDSPVYPMALTGTGKHDTEVLLYVASDHKLICDNRLTLRSAGLRETSPLDSLRNIDSVVIDPDHYRYLCKFRDRLTPAQMAEDIVFRPAPDDEPYRERVVRWW